MAAATCIFVGCDGSGHPRDGSLLFPDGTVWQGSAAELDDKLRELGSTPENGLLVSWGGHRWMHLLGDGGKGLYLAHVDLEAVFIAKHRFRIGLSAFDAVPPGPQSAATVKTLLDTVAEKGRLTWTTGESRSTKVFWAQPFLVPLGSVKTVTAPSWITNPESVHLACAEPDSSAGRAA